MATMFRVGEANLWDFAAIEGVITDWLYGLLVGLNLFIIWGRFNVGRWDVSFEEGRASMVRKLPIILTPVL